MTKRTGRLVASALIWTMPIFAQALGNQALSGRYYFRHVSIDVSGGSPVSLTGAHTLTGVLTFDGGGKYAFTGQQISGASAPVAASGAGDYAVDPGGFVSIDNPQHTGTKLNARYSGEALLGSTTETTDTTYDLFAAIPAPPTAASWTGSYTTVSIEFPGGSAANMRATQFSLTPQGSGALGAFSVTGHAANLGGGTQTQQISSATYTMGADGSGTLSLGAADSAQLLSGTRSVCLSASGNLILGGSMVAGGHDMLIGVRSMTGATNATWNSIFWGAGLRVDSGAAMGYAGSLAAHGQGTATWTRRIKASGVGQIDFTGINNYQLTGDGTGTAELTRIGVGVAGKAFVGVAVNDSDRSAYEVYFGVQVPSLSGTGVFINPLGVVNAASFAPPGNPISPGEFVTLYGSGLSSGNSTATPPYPDTLNGVAVQVNGKPAPVYFVSPGQINFLVPYSTTGPTATITVVNNAATSNAVTVPVATTSPGVYALDQSGSGPGAILHANYSLVNAANPAVPGETVLVYLTGMGTVAPDIADGTAGASGTLYKSNAGVTVLIGGQPASVSFNGLAPGYPGLYQLNVTLPPGIGISGNLPLAIQTANGYHDQVDIPVR